MTGKRRYEVGLDKLDNAAAEVGIMQNELIEKQPLLQQAAADVKAVMLRVEAESEDVAKVMCEFCVWQSVLTLYVQ